MSEEVKFTPGPWHACRDGNCECGVVSSGEFPICKVTSGDWGDDYPAIRLVGESSFDRKAEAYMEQITYGSISPDTAKANARLIAAAPEMFEEGRFLLDRLEEFERELSDAEFFREWAGHVAPAIARFRSAIAKAEGQQ